MSCSIFEGYHLHMMTWTVRLIAIGIHCYKSDDDELLGGAYVANR